MSKSVYRPDIDGLRAIAVLAVVAYHAFPSWMRGGFIGVDVFFVISGFLISGIVFNSLRDGTFSYTDFYLRRVRRIFPALLLVMVACYAFGWLVLLADEYKQLGKHIAGGAGFVVNLVLWGESGYFDVRADTKPLLHLWSLGVEEQFYLFWPWIAVLVWKFRQRASVIIGSIIAVSFLFNVRGVTTDPTGTFYSLHTRLWELACGGLLAWVGFLRAEASDGKSRLADVASLTGLLLLAAGFQLINRDDGFPGAWALIPVAGTVLLIAAGDKAWLNRWLLSNKLLTSIGLISYPLYLWHWPLLTFARIIEGEVPSITFRLSAVLLSLVLARGTYLLVETPLRFGSYGRHKALALVAAMIVVGSMGWITNKQDGLGFRAVASNKEYEGETGSLAYYNYLEQKYFVCQPPAIASTALYWNNEFMRCKQSTQSPDIDVAIIGDSHAEHLFPGLAEALPGKTVAFYIKDNPPFVENPDFAEIFRFLQQQRSIRQVVVAARWHGRLRQIPTGSSLGNEMEKVADLLVAAGKQVYFLDAVPDFPFSATNCRGRRWLAAAVHQCEFSAGVSSVQRQNNLDALQQVAKSRPAVRVFSINKYFCNDRVCSMFSDGALLFRDDNHLNVEGSRFVARHLLQDYPDLFQ